LLPGRALVEEGVIAGLDLEQAFGGLLAGSDPGQVAEVFESLSFKTVTLPFLSV
jgi:hypothetical protein